jgi:hypothetical protein
VNGRRPGLVEISAIWALLAYVAIAVIVTYSRIPTSELYHVSVGGIAGGFGRALVYVNFPVAVIAVAMLPFLAARLPATRAYHAAEIVAAVLCAVVAVPGVVDQKDLDAKWINAVPAAGVGLVLVLWALALRDGLGPVRPWERWDWLRLAAAIVIVIVALPWEFAEWGVYVSHVPVIGHLFLGAQIRPSAGVEPTLHAVHLGRHHGMDGTLCALSGIALTRVVVDVARGLLHELAAFATGALIVYGILNAANDAWDEQVWKRSWTHTMLPSFLRPGLTWGFLIVLVGAIGAYALVRRLSPPAAH